MEGLLHSKHPVDFTLKYWQLVASAFTVILRARVELLQEITSQDGVRMDKLKIRWVAYIPTMSYVTYLALFCSAMRDYSCK